MAGRGGAWPALAVEAIEARLCLARLDTARQSRRGVATLVVAWPSRHGAARLGMAMRGMAWLGRAKRGGVV